MSAFVNAAHLASWATMCPGNHESAGERRGGKTRKGNVHLKTALVMAARGNAPVVVFAGDAPIGASWYIQSIDQAPLALATGAHFVPIRNGSSYQACRNIAPKQSSETFRILSCDRRLFPRYES